MLKYLSTTLISNYADCPKRALTSHFDRQIHGDDNEGTDATRFGTIIHNVMEVVHHKVMTDGHAAISAGLVEEIFDQLWSESTCYDMDLYRLGKQKIAKYAMDSLSRRVGTTVAVELEFVYDVEAREVFICVPDMPNGDRNYYAQLVRDRGHTPVVSKIDRIDRVSEVEFEVFDYKTNIMPFTRDEIENSKQLGIYDLVVLALYPEAQKVWCVYDMFRHGRFPVEFNDQWRDDLHAFLINTWIQIQASIPKPEEKLNKYCRWCTIRANCATYQETLDYEVPPVLNDNIDTPEGIEDIYRQYQELGIVEKAVETRKKELSAMLSAKIEMDGKGDPIILGEREYYLMANVRYQYKIPKVIEILEHYRAVSLLPQIVNVAAGNMKTVLKSRPEILEMIESEARDKSFATPSPKARKVQAGKLKGEESDA